MKLLSFIFSFIVLTTYAQDKKRAVIFSGPTVCEGCDTALGDLMKEMGYEIEYVKPGESTAEKLKGASVYMVPGGEDVTAEDLKKTELQSWTTEDQKNIKQYVEDGGNYFGVCLGGFWASDWPGYTENFKSLELVSAHVMAAAKTEEERKARNERVIWNGKKRNGYFQDGPSWELVNENDPNIKIFARYKNKHVKELHNKVAAFIAKKGKGKVGVTGIHIEATPDWYKEDKIPNKSKHNRKMAKEFIQELMAP